MIWWWNKGYWFFKVLFWTFWHMGIKVQEGGLLLDKTANHFFFFCQRRGRAFCQKTGLKSTDLTWCVVSKQSQLSSHACWKTLRYTQPVRIGWRIPSQSSTWQGRVRFGKGVHFISRTSPSTSACSSCREDLPFDPTELLLFVSAILSHLFCVIFILNCMVLFCGFILVLVLAGVCPPRQLPATTTQDWVQLANIFETLHGGPAVCQHAASYLRGLAAGTLPQNELIPLEWHVGQI